MVYCISLLIFVLPLLMWPTVLEYDYAKSIFALLAISVLVVVWAVSALVRGEWRFRASWVALPVLGLVVAALFSLIHATNGRVVIQSVTLVVFFFLFYLTVAHFVKEKRDVTLILSSLLLSAFLASLYGLLQYLGVFRGAYGGAGLDEVISTMGNRNYLGEFLASLLFPASILVLRLRSRLLRLLAVLEIAFGFGVALLVRQTSLLVALPIAFLCLLVGIAIFRPIEPIRRNRGWIVALILVLSLTFLVGGPSGPLNSVVGLPAESQESWIARLWRENGGSVRSWDWRIGWEMFRDHPIVGVGLGNYKVDFLEYKAQSLASPEAAAYDFNIARATHAHSEYVQLAAELGAVGILALLWLLGTIAAVFWRRLRSNRDESDRLDLILCASGVITFLVVALFGFPAHLAPPSLVLALTMGLASSAAYGEGGAWNVRLKGRWLGGVAGTTIAACLCVSVIAARDFSGDVLLVRGIAAGQAGAFRVAEATLKQSAARDFAPSQALYYLGTALAEQGRYQEALAQFEKCLTRYVTEDVYLGLAYAAFGAGDAEKARKTIDLLLATRPHAVSESRAIYLTSIISAKEGQPDAGIAKLEALVQAHPDFEVAYIVFGDFCSGLGLAAKARENYERAIALIDEKLAALEVRTAPGTRPLAGESDQVKLLKSERQVAQRGLNKVTSP